MKRVLTLKTIFFFLLIQFAFIGEWTIQAASFGNESLNYTISYKWGVIHKDAANATLSCREDGNNYKFFLTAKTLPWADSYFQVRDTLTSIVSKDGFKVQKYIKEAHEGEHYSKDIVDFKYAGSVVKGTTTRLRKKNNEPIRKSGTSLTAGGPTFDMLSVFYFLRTLDYQNMTPKKITKVNIFSGKYSEILSIKYVGKETIKLKNGTKREAFKLSFSFTRDGKKKSSDDMTAWISVDSRHIPLYLVGKLPVGEMRVYYIN